jgi:hypothetical protein
MSKQRGRTQTIIYVNPWGVKQPKLRVCVIWVLVDSSGFGCTQVYRFEVPYGRYYLVTNHSWGVETEDTTLG